MRTHASKSSWSVVVIGMLGALAFVAAETPLWAQGATAGKGNAKGVLDGVGTRRTAAEIREWIVNAPAMAAKTKAERKPPMKAYPQLPAEDVDGLVAYLQTLK
jgi:hypothetical protein